MSIVLDGNGAITGLTATGISAVQQLPAGSVIQVVQTYLQSNFSTSSTSYTNVTGLSASITPTKSSSKILVMVSVMMDGYANQNFMAVTRGGSLIGQSSGGTSFNGMANSWGFGSGSSGFTLVSNYLDSPATTSSTTYQVQVAKPSSGGSPSNLFVNTTVNGNFGGVSSVTLLEIAQ
jgi:hypothetical protein